MKLKYAKLKKSSRLSPSLINPLPPSDAVRKQKNILENFLSLVLLQFKKYQRPWKPEI